jgi:predicted glycoside hydrolase/deacetylase ChbG (UPF0249 family)
MLEEGPPLPRLIVTADDMGLSATWDEAIVRAWGRGVVTSASIVTTGRSYRDTIRRIVREDIDHGVHLDLLDGAPLSPVGEISSLVDERGRFHPLRALLLRFASGRVRTDEVELEWSRQIERALGDGLRPTHLNGHYHLHLLPGVFGVTVRLASRFGMGWVRVPDEAPWLALRVPGSRPARVAKTTVLWMLSRAQVSSASRPEVGHVGCRAMVPGGRGWLESLQSIRGDVTEVLCHPGQSDGETVALLSAELRNTIDRRFRPTSFRDLHGAS